MELARMTSKGQLTVPASIRKKLGISTGDQLLFYERDGQIVLAPVTPASLADAQAAAARKHIYTLEEIRAIAVPHRRTPPVQAAHTVWLLCPQRGYRESDLDFCADVPEDFGLFRLGALQSDLEEAFRKKVDLITSGMLNDPLSEKLAQNTAEDGVILYSVDKRGSAGYCPFRFR